MNGSRCESAGLCYLKAHDTTLLPIMYIYIYINTAQEVTFPGPSSANYDFQTIYHIINFITMLGVEYNKTYFDTRIICINHVKWP